MNLLSEFKDYLFSQRNAPSPLTVKNYLADIRRFIRWYEARFEREFVPTAITPEILTEFRKDQIETTPGYKPQPSIRSVERYMSSLRKFFFFLKQQETIGTNPFDLLTQQNVAASTPDPWHLQKFREHLYISKAARFTIKNYLLDLNQFFSWLEIVMGKNDHYDLKERNLLTHIDRLLLEEYKHRLTNEAQASPKTVNRKLSSLRRYITWAQSEGFIKQFPADSLPTNVTKQADNKSDNPPIAIATATNEMSVLKAAEPEVNRTVEEEVVKPKAKENAAPRYSRFAPVRLGQKISRFSVILFDQAVVLPVSVSAEALSYAIWKAKGSPVFVDPNRVGISKKFIQLLDQAGLLEKVSVKKSLIIENLPKSFYAPLSLSLRHAPLHKKAWHHVRYTRPSWYRRYHSYKFVHYVHAALLVVCMSAAGFGVVQAMAESLGKPVALASLPDGPPRILAFKGKITKPDSSPITAHTQLRFSIYNDSVASGSSMLWQETQLVKPDSEGNFSTLLGQIQTIPQRLFKENARLYIGMTVEQHPELKPRKQIPTEVLAATSDTVQGLRPITDPAAGQKNTILALDSSGNLIIGGNANPLFMATGGTFTIAGQTVLLSTMPGSNSDIRISPDGTGKIDLQKPLHNTSNTSTIPGFAGGVEIADSLAVNANESSQSALFINQNSSGSLISASVSGIAKFTLQNTGAATFGDSIMIEGGSLHTTQTSFNLLTTNPINLAIGTSATALSLGGSNGETKINNAQTVISGNLVVNGAQGAAFGNPSAGITFSGQGNHLISATAGSLQLGNVALTGTTTLNQNVSIVPAGTDGENNLGSAANPFDTLYVNTIVSPNMSGATVWQNQGGAISPAQLSSSIMVGSTASSSAVWQVFGAGANAGTASSSGNLSFQGTETKINQLNGGSLTFQTSPGGDAELTARITLLSNGNVGIGTSTPQNRLDLDTGTGEALNWVSTSSRRYKKDITVINDPLEKIGQLQGVYYTWDSTHGGKRALGFIAEDVGAVLPEVVEWEENGIDAKGISYGHMTALAIEGIKAQQREIDDLRESMGGIKLTNDRNYHLLTHDGAFFTVVDEEQREAAGIVGLRKAVIATLEAGQSLMGTVRADAVLTDYLDVSELTVTGSLKATKGTILSLHTDTIMSTDEDAQLSLSLGRSHIGVYAKDSSGQTEVASIDTLGNARFTGTLMAKKLTAEELELTDEGMMKLIARITRVETQQKQAVSEAINLSISTTIASSPTEHTAAAGEEVSADAIGHTASASAEIEPQIITKYEDFATASAALDLVPVHNTPYNSTLPPVPAVTGMVLADLSVADMVTISGNFVLSKGGIDVVGADLALQPLRAGGVSILSGLVAIDPAGNLSVEGNARFAGDVMVKGKLAASVLSPVDGQDLVVRLGEKNPSLVIQNATGAANLQIQSTGDLTSSGKANFSSLLSKSLRIMRGSQADASPVKTIASSSAGTASILPGQTQRTIVTPFVADGALIYITPTSDTLGMVPYISRQTNFNQATGSEGSFTIQIAQSVSKPIKVNWWIVN